MAFAFNCRVLGVDCDWETTADTREGVMAQVREHAREGKHPIHEVIASQSVRNVGTVAS